MVEQTKKTAAKKAATVKSKAAKAEPAPAVKKAKSPTAKAPSKKPATGKSKSPVAEHKPAVQPTPEERYRMVETAAYFIAEQHGFQGRSDEHWAAAERAIAAKLGQ